jgi:hypothetical protein
MAWDPITKIVGSLGIFRGYSVFMQGKDFHFITSRITWCGAGSDTQLVRHHGLKAFAGRRPRLG